MFKKSLFFVVVIWFLVLPFNAIAEAKEKAGNSEIKPKIKVAKMWEKSFDKDIEDIAIDSDGKMKAIVTDADVRFFDDIGSVKKTINVKRGKWGGGAKISENGKYVMLSHSNREFVKNIEYYDSTGILLWKREKLEGDYSISPDGNTVAIINFIGNDKYSLEFLNKNGNLIKNAFFDSGEFSKMFMKFSKNGEYLIYALDGYIDIYEPNEREKEERKIIERKAIKFFYLFNKNGELLWKKDFSKGVLREIDISNDGNVSCIAADTGYADGQDILTIECYGKEGSMLIRKQLKKGFIKSFKLSGEGHYMGLIYYEPRLKEKFLYLDLVNNAILIEKETEFSAIDISAKGDYISLFFDGPVSIVSSPNSEGLADLIYRNDFEIFHKSGELIFDEKRGKQKEKGIGKIYFNGNNIQVIESKKIWKLKMEIETK